MKNRPECVLSCLCPMKEMILDRHIIRCKCKHCLHIVIAKRDFSLEISSFIGEPSPLQFIYRFRMPHTKVIFSF